MSVYTRTLGAGTGQAVCDVCGWRSASAAEDLAREWAEDHAERCRLGGSAEYRRAG